MTDSKIMSAGLQEVDVRGEPTIILRGVITVEDLKRVKYGDYQRELFPQSSRANIITGLKKGDVLPDITLGMRSQRFNTDGDTYILHDELWCIDGQQRIGSAIEYAAQHPHKKVVLGCVVHFSTTEAYERERFHALNAWQKKMSPNVLLHNVRDQYRPVLMFYGLTQQAGFVLHNRVCWMQNKHRGNLLSALVGLKMITNLHSHLSPGRSNSIKEVLSSLVQLEAKLGMQHMRDNTAQFWNLIEECWGIRNIVHHNCAPQMRGGFLVTLARVLSDHSNFWRVNGKQLFVEADMRRKIATFDLHAQGTEQLCGGSGASLELLYGMLVRHINKSKKTGTLKPWKVTVESRQAKRAQAAGTEPRPAPS